MHYNIINIFFKVFKITLISKVSIFFHFTVINGSSYVKTIVSWFIR